MEFFTEAGRNFPLRIVEFSFSIDWRDFSLWVVEVLDNRLTKFSSSYSGVTDNSQQTIIEFLHLSDEIFSVLNIYLWNVDRTFSCSIFFFFMWKIVKRKIWKSHPLQNYFNLHFLFLGTKEVLNLAPLSIKQKLGYCFIYTSRVITWMSCRV